MTTISAKFLIDHDELRQALHYEPLTGLFTRLVGCGRRGAVGDIAGTLTPQGYVVISYKCHRYLAQVLAWFWMTGRWPESLVDHENRDTTNNRWGNLRPATKLQNAGNSIAHRDNTSGFKGVSASRTPGKWRATIGTHGKQLHLGTFPTRETAHAAYTAAAKQHFKEFARL